MSISICFKQEDENFLKKLSGSNTELRISLDSHIPAVHDENRGKGSFDKTYDNIKFLQKSNVNFSLKSVITKSNIGDLSKMLELSHSLGASGFSYGVLYNIGRTQSNDNLWFNDNYCSEKEITQSLFTLIEANPQYAKLLGPTGLRHIVEHLFFKKPAYVFEKCWPYFHYDGFMYPQDQLPQKEYRLSHLADINAESILDIKNRFLEFKNKHERSRVECMDCDFFPFCIKGNYGELYSESSFLQGEFPTCHQIKELFNFIMTNGQRSANIAKLILK